MATYFHGNPAEIQPDGLQTLILMNPGYNVGYSATTHHQPPSPSATSNFAFQSSSSNNKFNNSFDAPPTTNAHQFVGIPLPLTSSVDAAAAHPFHGLIPRAQYHFYGQFDDQALPAAREINRSQQGLSLTLSSQEMGGGGSRAAVLSPTSGGGSPSSASGISNNGGIVGTGVQSVLLGSKYLKATQELLEETVTVGKGKGGHATVKATRESSPGEGETRGELTTAERQEIQMKKAKLVHMLDEVEQRYSQYHHQIQMVISWFEQIAGIGSARTYTALAVETISKQFRCLKDTILGQIKAASKSLGEEVEEEDGKNEGSRLKFVDHQLRQQKTLHLQQLGMIQPNAWRPQRGLPERSVSVLRAWLFEHFLHPYPKDSDKQMLAKQTGLTRSQVSNWFINARVRLWKPMVEEMYMEETKEQEKTGSDEKKKKKDNDPTSLLNNRNPSLFALIDSSNMELEIHGSPKKQRSNDNEMEMNAEQGEEVIHGGGAPASTNGQDQILMKFANDQRQTRDVGFSILGATPTNFIGGFGTYFSSDQFPGSGYSTNNNGSVSLTLGLPHCENPNQSFLPNNNNNNPNNMGLGGRRLNLGEQQNEFGIGALSSPAASTSSSHRPVVYETVNLQNRKRFAA